VRFLGHVGFRDVSWTIATGGKRSPHEVFSNAFTLLLRFWWFDRLPIEQVRANAATPPLGSLFSPKNLLLVQNGRLAKFGRSTKDSLKLKRRSKLYTLKICSNYDSQSFWFKIKTNTIITHQNPCQTNFGFVWSPHKITKFWSW